MKEAGAGLLARQEYRSHLTPSAQEPGQHLRRAHLRATCSDYGTLTLSVICGTSDTVPAE